MIKPNYEDFKELCRQGNLIPMATEMPGDLDTPLSALLKIDDSQSSFLLESVEGGERWARYSFLGSNPRAIIKSRNGTVEIHTDEGAETIGGVSDPTRLVKQIMERFRAVLVPGLPEFFGGAVGFLSYDVVRDFERIPDLGKPGPGFHDAWFMVTRDPGCFRQFLTQDPLNNHCLAGRNLINEECIRGRLRQTGKPGTVASLPLRTGGCRQAPDRFSGILTKYVSGCL